jgi:DNA-binding CsgD family transcriptional regulator
VQPTDPIPALEHGRACHARRDWADAYEALAAADGVAPLAIDDLERLAWSAALIGRDDAMLVAQERVYQACVEAGQPVRAARAAFWSGFRLFSMGEQGRATAWLARAQRLVEGHGEDCAIPGYLLLPVAHRHLAAREYEAALDSAARAATIGERCRERDLTALARNLQGRALVRLGRMEQGLALLDETMLAVTAGELSPLVTGLIYCNVIAACQQVCALSRSREWTAALALWCEAQPQLVKFTGNCLVHRAEIMQFSGAWDEALEEARRAAAARAAGPMDREAVANGLYQQAEIHRLRGDFAASEAAYARASGLGREPQPGLALLRLAQGQRDAAVTAIRRVLAATSDPLARIALLPAGVEILLAAGAVDEACTACDALEQLADSYDTEVLHAIAARSRASVQLAAGAPQQALEPLARAFHIWQRSGAPYMAARVRMLAARACRALGDDDAARLELRAARAVFEHLGARPDLAALDTLDRAVAPADGSHGLSPRELQVLRLVAAGHTNKAIARELSLSDKTIDRHVSKHLHEGQRGHAGRRHRLRVRAQAGLNRSLA